MPIITTSIQYCMALVNAVEYEKEVVHIRLKEKKQNFHYFQMIWLPTGKLLELSSNSNKFTGYKISIQK